MKLEPVYLDELNTQSKDYKVSVTVAEKGRAHGSPKKPGVIFQTLILEDTKKNKMRCSLFGDQIPAYEEVFVPKGKYEISKAPISVVEGYQQLNLEELPYQMTIGQQTVIQRIDSETGSIVPKYPPLFTIPRAVDPDGRYDVVAVVLFVEDQARMIPNIRGRDSPVREIIVTDTSQERPITISAWNDLAGKECDALCTWTEKFNVIGFTALKTRLTKATGFALNTTMSTRIIHEPKGDKADVLRKWATMYPQMLLDRQEKVFNVCYPNTIKNFMTIAELRAKKEIHTMQNEIARIKVTIPEPEMSRITAYVGCQGCGKRTNIPVGTPFPCNACRKKDSISSHRVIFKFECSDQSGTMTFTAFNDATEKLFRKSATEIFSIKTTENVEAFTKIQKTLSTKPFTVQVTPSQELETNNVLIWILKDIEIIDDITIPEVRDSSSAELSHQLVTKPSDKGKGIEHELLMETEVHGKEPLYLEYGSATDYSQIPEYVPDEVLADIAQFQEYNLSQQLFEEKATLPLLTISEQTAAEKPLPTWAQLSRTRSKSMKRTSTSASGIAAASEEHVSKKKFKPSTASDIAAASEEQNAKNKLKATMFVEIANPEESDKKESPTSTLNQP